MKTRGDEPVRPDPAEATDAEEPAPFHAKLLLTAAPFIAIGLLLVLHLLLGS